MNPLDSLWDQFDPHATIITPQPYLAKQLTHDYHQRQRQQNLVTWPTPDIISLHGWLTRHWLQTSDPAILIKPSVEPLVWRQIIQHQLPASILEVSQLAHLACQAWTVLHQWQLPITESLFKTTVDSHYFWQWQQQFRQYCQQQHCITLAQIGDALLPQLDHIDLAHPIFFIGFAQYTPQLQNLIQGLRQYRPVTLINPALPQASVQTREFANETSEIHAMLTWARQQSTSHKVACVVPGLPSLVKKILSIDAKIAEKTTPLTLSQPLTQYPIIHTALISLQWLTTTMPTYLIRRWLRSPFIIQAECDFFHYSQLDRLIAAQSVSQLSLTALCDLFSAVSQSVLLERLQQVRQLQIPTTACASQWGQLFWQCLTILGWPGERTLTDDESLLIEQWQQLMQTFAGLDPILQSMSLPQALQNVNQLATSHHWPSPTIQTPIQFFDQHLTSGLEFDQVWVMGMDDESWPPPLTPNPLLPHALQRQYQIPHASAEQQLQFAKRLTDQWRQSCQHLHISFAKQAGDRHRQLSQLYTRWPTVDAIETPPVQFDFNLQAARLETWDEAEIPLPPLTQPMRGGSGILTAQAQCPFQAFAKYRLQVTAPETPITGVSHLVHGQLAHQALDYFWTHMQTQQQLIESSPQQITQWLEQCIDRALTSLANDEDTHELFFSLEKKRLQRLLERWLIVERARPDFNVIAVEQTYTLDVAGLPITIRCDRIDQLNTGAHLLLDYKTGSATPSHWFGERPLQPQLPLYQWVDPTLNAISFAQLTPDELGFKGVSDQATDIAGIKPIDQMSSADTNDWHQQQQYWHTQLTQLSQAFQQGVATVDPKPGVCRTCQLQSLCRIQECVK